MKSPYKDSLEHTIWECKYHIVFAPKFKRKEIYGTLKRKIGMILRELCRRKEVEVINEEACLDYIYVCKYTTPSKCIIIHGIFERKEYINNICETCKFKI